jgi:uncharacterized cupredoxin-like copper-binding protein
MRSTTKLIPVAVAGLLCGAALVGTAVARAADTAVSVTLTNTKISLSEKTVMVGTVKFTVANKSTTARKFSIAGKTTPAIAPGKTATLRVKFTSKGSYAHVSSGRGRTVKGALVVVSPTPQGTAIQSGSSASSSSTAGLNVCMHPVSTTVHVLMTDGHFEFSQTTIPCGSVTFVMTNAGTLEHIISLGGGAKPGLNPGQTGSMTVNLTPGDQYWECGTFGHDDVGEQGVLVIV